jgi:hypothetical protein
MFSPSLVIPTQFVLRPTLYQHHILLLRLKILYYTRLLLLMYAKHRSKDTKSILHVFMWRVTIVSLVHLHRSFVTRPTFILVFSMYMSHHTTTIPATRTRHFPQTYPRASTRPLPAPILHLIRTQPRYSPTKDCSASASA